MISTRYGFIFIHIPKTGGTSIQYILLPYSDDVKIVGPKHDGVDQFEIGGDHTPHKHVGLSQYASREDFSRFHVAATIRHPVDRLISLYFSPSKWMQKEPDGRYRRGRPYWDRQIFLASIMHYNPISSYLKVNDKVIMPDTLLYFDDLEASFAAFARRVGLPNDLVLPRVNVSDANDEEIKLAKSDPVFIEAADRLYQDDLLYFTLNGCYRKK